MIFDAAPMQIILTVNETPKKLSVLRKSWFRTLAGMSSQTYNNMLLPVLLQSIVKGEWKLKIKNWPYVKL